MDSTEPGTSRRDVLKKTAAAAATAGLVWSAPKVEGLSLRPNYAAASSSVIAWTTSVATSGAVFDIPAILASPAVNSASAVASSAGPSGVRLFVFLAGTGLGAAQLNIDAVSSAVGPVAFTPQADATGSTAVTTEALVAGSPAFPLQISGNFSCA